MRPGRKPFLEQQAGAPAAASSAPAIFPLPVDPADDLRAWLGTWAAREALSPAGASEEDHPAKDAATQALADILGSSPTAVVARLAPWLNAHIRHGLQTELRHWQWNLVLHLWCLEQAGIAEHAVRAPSHVDMLIQELGIRATAARQAPVSVWTYGVRGCNPLCHFPGQRGMTGRKATPALQINLDVGQRTLLALQTYVDLVKSKRMDIDPEGPPAGEQADLAQPAAPPGTPAPVRRRGAGDSCGTPHPTGGPRGAGQSARPPQPGPRAAGTATGGRAEPVVRVAASLPAGTVDLSAAQAADNGAAGHSPPAQHHPAVEVGASLTRPRFAADGHAGPHVRDSSTGADSGLSAACSSQSLHEAEPGPAGTAPADTIGHAGPGQTVPADTLPAHLASVEAVATARYRGPVGDLAAGTN